MQINRQQYDAWKTRVPDERPDLEIAVVDAEEIPKNFLRLDEGAVYLAWLYGVRDFPGLDVREVTL